MKSSSPSERSWGRESSSTSSKLSDPRAGEPLSRVGCCIIMPLMARPSETVSSKARSALLQESFLVGSSLVSKACTGVNAYEL